MVANLPMGSNTSTESCEQGSRPSPGCASVHKDHSWFKSRPLLFIPIISAIEKTKCARSEQEAGKRQLHLSGKRLAPQRGSSDSDPHRDNAHEQQNSCQTSHILLAQRNALTLAFS